MRTHTFTLTHVIVQMTTTFSENSVFPFIFQMIRVTKHDTHTHTHTHTLSHTHTNTHNAIFTRAQLPRNMQYSQGHQGQKRLAMAVVLLVKFLPLLFSYSSSSVLTLSLTHTHTHTHTHISLSSVLTTLIDCIVISAGSLANVYPQSVCSYNQQHNRTLCQSL